jgi:drug/metabolite transporter (DMT)-like permease
VIFEGRKRAILAGGDVQGRLLLIVLCLVWGNTWPLMRIALYSIPPLSMRTMTAGFGALTLLLICLVTGRSLRVRSTKAWLHLIVVAVLNVGAFSVLTGFAQLATATSRVTVLVYTMPIWTVLLAWPILGERPARVHAVAISLCAVGLAILIYPLAANGLPQGIIFAAAAGLAWAGGTVYLKWSHIDADPLGVTAWQVILGFFIIVACLYGVDGRFTIDHANASALLATIFTGIAGSGIAYATWFEIVRRLPAVTASLGTLANPVIGVISTALIIGERPTGTDLVGFAFIFAASACVLLVPHPVASSAEGIRT